MSTVSRKLLTIVVEAAVERQILDELKKAGVGGFTMVEARGYGDRGQRDGDWEQSRSVRIESICEEGTAMELASRLLERWGKHYALILWLQDVDVLRARKFESSGGTTAGG